jgi:3-hydroxy-9,10-secoandrosta-1,3,5(10)-triene-9,17-dione monooxygenase reductase component
VWDVGRGGVLVLDDALACLECEIVAEHPAGDRWIVVGRVDDLRSSAADEPLVFFAGAYGHVAKARVKDRISGDGGN